MKVEVEFYGTENKVFSLLPLIGYDWKNRVICYAGSVGELT